MGKSYTEIPDNLVPWIEQQPMFFVATAPLAATGHVNCSPKGGDALRIVDRRTAIYHDLTGSGAETLAHLRENGRLVIMLCAFTGPPQIVRLYGEGTVLLPGQPAFEELRSQFPPHLGTRSIVRLAINRVGTSCGFGVPLMALEGQRDILDTWSEKKGAEGLVAYRQRKNARSIDGLPALVEEP